MVLSYPYLWSHIKHNSFTGLPLFVYWDVFPNSPYLTPFIGYLYQGFVEIYQTLIWLSCVLGLIVSYGNTNLAIACMSSLTHSTHMVAKTLYLNVIRRQLQWHLEEMEVNIQKCRYFNFPSAPITFEQHFKNESRFVRRAQSYHLLVEIVTHLLYFAGNIYDNVTAEEGEPWIIPIVADLLYDSTTCAGYIVTFTLQSIAFHLISARMVSADYFLLDIIVLHTSYTRYLTLVMSRLISAQNNKIISNDEKNRYLKQWVVQMQQEEIMLSSLKSILPGYLFIEYVYMLVHTCIPFFVITSTNSWTPVQKVGLFGIALSGQVVFFVLAKGGRDLWQARCQLQDLFYGTKLLAWRELRLVYHMTAMKLAKPFYFTVATVFPLSLETFLGIGKMILTYYMALRELTDRNV